MSIFEKARELAVINSSAAVIGWDQETYLPHAAAQHRADQLAWLSSRAHELATSDAWKRISKPPKPRSRHRSQAHRQPQGTPPRVRPRHQTHGGTRRPRLGGQFARQTRLGRCPRTLGFPHLRPAPGNPARHRPRKGGALGLSRTNLTTPCSTATNAPPAPPPSPPCSTRCAPRCAKSPPRPWRNPPRNPPACRTAPIRSPPSSGSTRRSPRPSASISKPAGSTPPPIRSAPRSARATCG